MLPILIFLGFAVAVMSIVIVVITAKYSSVINDMESEQRKYNIIKAEKNTLILEKLSLLNKNAELYNDNVKLTAAYRELKAINQELMNTESVMIEDELEQKNNFIPDGHTNTFRCEDYRLFDSKSQQAALQRECITISNTGIRAYVSKQGYVYYCAALAGAYGTEIGHAYKVKLRCGTEFNVIMGDFKHPIDNVRLDDYGDPDVNYDGQPTTSIIEFIVDMDAIPEAVRQAGTMSALNEFGGLYGDGGDIVEIKDTGRVRKW